MGIKVRDFAYESKLPPIQPIYRHPRQIQPAVVRTTLKRQWAESGEDDYFSQSSSQPETSQKKLERTSTEPAIPPALDSTAIDDYYEYDSLHTDSQQANNYPGSQQMPLPIFESQESEPYVDTPLVTPKGSLQMPVADTSNIPASQLDAESQSTAEPASHSSLNFSFSPKLPATPNPTFPLASALSLASIDDSSKIINSSPPRPPHGKTTTTLDQQPVDPTCDVHAPTMPRVLTMRYHLRRRPVTPSSPLPTKSPSRLHNLRPRNAVSRPHCTSIQSSHSRAKPKSECSSPSSRTLLRRAVTNGQEKRRRTS